MRSAPFQTLFHIPSRCRRTRPDREVNPGFHFEKGNGFASDGSSRKAEPSAPYSWYAPMATLLRQGYAGQATPRMGPYHVNPSKPWRRRARSRLPRNGSPLFGHMASQPDRPGVGPAPTGRNVFRRDRTGQSPAGQSRRHGGACPGCRAWNKHPARQTRSECFSRQQSPASRGSHAPTPPRQVPD